MLKQEEIAVLICDMCGHAHGAHTWLGCMGTAAIFIPLPNYCTCPGFLKVNYEDTRQDKK